VRGSSRSRECPDVVDATEGEGGGKVRNAHVWGLHQNARVYTLILLSLQSFCIIRIDVLSRMKEVDRMGYVFEWDPEKAEANMRKHGIGFNEASTVFGDPLALLLPDPDHSSPEMRHLLLGISNKHRLMVVAFAERPPRTRLISARQATRQERRKYEEEA